MATSSTQLTATGASAASVINAGAGKNFRCISLRVTSAAPDTVAALETSPDNTTWTAQDTVTGSGWGTVATHHLRQYARVNCSNLGTGGKPVQVVVVGQPA